MRASLPIVSYIFYLALVYNLNPPVFDLKIVYSYAIEVADFESDLCLYSNALVYDIFAFNFLWNMHEVHQYVVIMYILYTLVNFFLIFLEL